MSILRVILTASLMFSLTTADAADAPDDHSGQLAESVTIHRDEWGVAHILGPTDECVVFGMGYAQAEDYFWQVEDTTIRALKILSELSGCTFEQFQALAFDTRLYWPETQLPEFARQLDEYEKQDPEAAGRIRPYLQHLLDWDFRATNECTRTALCVAWHEELHQGTYPGETLKPEYAESRTAQLEALATVAEQLQSLHGTWTIPWGDVHRIQRVHNQSEVIGAAVLLNRWIRSLPCPGAPGPLGVVYTVYSTPSIPVVRPERYGVVGSCYVGVVKFGDRIRAASAVQFGASSNPQSKHYFDQATLFSEGRLKPAWFYPADVLAHAVRSYHPGD